MKKLFIIGLASFFGIISTAQSATFMSAEWGTDACAAWNASDTLTTGLGGEWADNNGGRGHKVIQMYNMDCSDAPTTEMRISSQDGKAMCTYGGAVENSDLDKGTDYIMFAKAKNWAKMGSGKDGPMKAMSFGRLKFKGPKMEANERDGAIWCFS